MVQELNKLEDDVHQYLKMSGKPPKAYLDSIDKNIAIITRNKEINKILSNPAVQIMGLLPGAGVVTGTLKLIKGDTFGGFMDVFGAIVTYGSFLKLARVAQAYRKSSKPTVELLYSYRYRKLVSSITSVKMMDKITETSLKHSGTFLGNLFSTVGKFKSLKGQIDSIALLHKNRDYIIDLTSKAITGINAGLITNTTAYLKFLEDLGNVNATAEFFAHIRVLHAAVKSGTDAYSVTLEAMDDVKNLLGFTGLPGVAEFNPLVTENVKTMFKLMRGKKFKIEEIIGMQTQQFSSCSLIIEHFNKSLAQYDMFGVNTNADVRYQNTHTEMLLALDEIADKWAIEKRDRDDWIEANKRKYIHKCQHELNIQWAVNNKSRMLIDIPQSLETRIANFLHKLKGQIALREALQGAGELPFLENTVKLGLVPDTNIIFDFNSEFFCSHGSNLVKKYY